jgi:formate dehydrogenase maturation protein FdhE
MKNKIYKTNESKLVNCPICGSTDLDSIEHDIYNKIKFLCLVCEHEWEDRYYE